MQRLADGTVQEVILATNPNLEGEATATYLSRLLHTLEIAVTRSPRLSAVTSSTPTKSPSVVLEGRRAV